MKKTFKLLASLTLGLLVASCQNGLEEVINESAVQDELATTRAEDEEPVDEIDAIELHAAELRAASVNLSISGYSIISGTEQEQYTVSSPTPGFDISSFYVDWVYNTSVLYETAGGDGNTTVTLKLLSSTNTSDTYLTVYLRNLITNVIEYATTIYIGCNGPRANTSSVRVVRSSDGVEVYPSYLGLSPNTWYYAYFTNPYTYNMTLQWVFNHATIISQYGYTVYFQTDSTGWTTMTVNGKMPGSTVYKYMLGVTLYGGEYNPANIGIEESEGWAEEE